MVIAGPFDAVVGRNGIAHANAKREGDGKTPSGSFELGPAFGYAAESPTKLPYRQANTDDIWIDDPSSPDYNSWTKRGATPAKSFEVMHRDDDLYAVGVVIGYNRTPVIPGHGSAIFLHVWGGPEQATSGCVALERKNLETILARFDPSKHPTIEIQGPRPPQVAITMDDFDISDTTKLDADARSKAILAALAKHEVHAGLFVSCKNLKSARDYQRLAIWTRRGHLIGNHTFSHLYFGPKLSVDEASADIRRCDGILAKTPTYDRRFRYPFLAEGDTPEKRDALRAWLAKEGYKSGAVTIDTSDWYIDQRLRERLAKDPNADLTAYRDFYLNHLWEHAQTYDRLSNELFGRSVSHTLLTHFNLVNALFLDDALAMFAAKGWKLIDAKEAFADPVFETTPASMPAGQSILWGHAKARGLPDMRYPAEDGPYVKVDMDRLGL